MNDSATYQRCKALIRCLQIAKWVAEHDGRADIAALATQLRACTRTIRRDLEALAIAGYAVPTCARPPRRQPAPIRPSRPTALRTADRRVATTSGARFRIARARLGTYYTLTDSRSGYRRSFLTIEEARTAARFLLLRERTGDGTQPPSGLRGDPAAPRTVTAPTRDPSSSSEES